MCDTVIVTAGSTVRIVTTGGGGWGDPLLREVDKVVYDVECGLVSPESARDDYGVVLTKSVASGRRMLPNPRSCGANAHRRGKPPMFDRGPQFGGSKRPLAVNSSEGWGDGVYPVLDVGLSCRYFHPFRAFLLA